MLGNIAKRYGFPFDNPDAYGKEPTDEEATLLARALAHWVAAYGDPATTAKDIVEEVLSLNSLNPEPMSRDECVAIANVFRLDI